MKLTDSQEFPYPEQNDAATPLHLQLFAEAVDARASDMISSYTELLQRPVTMVSRSSDQTGFPGGLAQTQVLFNQYLYQDQNDFSSDPSEVRFNYWDPGMYLAGAYISSIAPTPTLNTVRKLWMYVEDRPGPAFTELSTQFWDSETFESNTSGEAQVVMGMFPIYNYQEARLYVMFSHNNPTVVTVQATSHLWVTRIGDLEL
jgi:hypothetical protein